jgi:hypothetical protein
MWVVTKAGFFSAVQKFNSDDLTIRARVREDLVHLLDYLPRSPESYQITATPQQDYEYRLICHHEDWAQALALLGKEIDYDNFKSEIGRTDPKRESILHSVWSALWGLSEHSMFASLYASSAVPPTSSYPSSRTTSGYHYPYVPLNEEEPLPASFWDELGAEVSLEPMSEEDLERWAATPISRAELDRWKASLSYGK